MYAFQKDQDLFHCLYHTACLCIDCFTLLNQSFDCFVHTHWFIQEVNQYLSLQIGQWIINSTDLFVTLIYSGTWMYHVVTVIHRYTDIHKFFPVALWISKMSIRCALLIVSHSCTFHLLFYECYNFGHTCLFTHCFSPTVLVGKYAIFGCSICCRHFGSEQHGTLVLLQYIHCVQYVSMETCYICRNVLWDIWDIVFTMQCTRFLFTVWLHQTNNFIRLPVTVK